LELLQVCEVAKKCRDAQKAYFGNRLPSSLNEAKELESKLDRALRWVFEKDTPGLFGDTTKVQPWR
jgi:hypothetical protein